MSVIARLNAALSGRYTLLREIGKGGMATVYLADDVRHNRKVALKVLKPELAAVVGSERFLAEIETTANLQHPHILPLFDSGEADGFLFFVMPYIEGETLREKIDREKQLPVDEAVGIATAVASALSVAHEQGVIHRDIKPANILLSRGEPLVTDFGIAIAVTNSSGARLTETGLSVGTPYYMSPEQATGDREVTPASDVYALGCVLYEMLVGEPPYVGSTAQAVLGKILTEKPRHPTAVRAMVPANVEGAVLQALEKLPADRFRSASGFVRAITDTSFRYGEASQAGVASAAPGPWKRATLAVAGFSALLVGGILWSAVVARRAPGPTPVVLELTVPADVGNVRDIAVSKDGTMFAIRGSVLESPLWIRRIDEADFRPIPGTEGAGEMDFSPDGQWLAFYHPSRRALLKIPVSGGGVVPILEVDSIRPDDMHWGENGTIVFVNATGGGTWGISDTGEGGARLLAGGVGIDPQVLPDGSGALADRDGAIYFIDFATDSVHRLVEGIGPKYLSTGHILYSGPATGSLFVVPFDLRRHEVTGPPVPVLDGYGGEDADDYSVSRNGTLVYLQGAARALNVQQGERQLVFRDRSGRPEIVPFTPRPLAEVAISPDGRYVAYATRTSGSAGTRQIQILDLLTGGTPEVATEGSNTEPVWSPDGTRLAIGHEEAGTNEWDVFVIRLDGASAPERVLARPGAQRPVAWTDDDLVVIEEALSPGNLDLVLLSLADSGQVRPYLQANYVERGLRLSPDGTLAAYESSETGSLEIYVRGFPEPLGKQRISAGGGRDVRWSPDGDELYFWRYDNGTGPDSLFAVTLQREPDLAPGQPELLFTVPAFQNNWDVHPDGRFLMAQDVNNEWVGEPRYLVVLNWFTELEARLGR